MGMSEHSERANRFVGLPVCGAFLARLPPPPSRVRLFTPGDLHLTVAFLGASGRAGAERALAALDEALSRDPLAPFAYALGEVIPLGNPRRYSALSATLTAGREEAARLIASLRDPLIAAAGARPDERPPLPHVTLARPSRRADRRDRDAGLAWARGLDLGEVTGEIDRIALYTWAEERRERHFRVVAERALGPRRG